MSSAILIVGVLWVVSSYEAPDRVLYALSYKRGPEAEHCPNAESLRQDVAAQLGYDPFGVAASPRIVAEILQDQGILTARISLFDRAGELAGERTLISEHNDCQELAASLALAMAIAIDPMSVGSRPDEPSHPPPAVPTQPVVPKAQVDPRTPDEEPFHLRAGLGAVLALGVSPNITGGLVVQIGLRRESFSFGLEGRADIPTAVRAAGGEVSASLMAGGARACWHMSIFKGCALVMAGAIRGSGHELQDARVVTTPFVGIGGRVGVEWAATEVFVLGGHLDFLGSVVSTTLQVNGEDVWRSPPVAGSLGATISAVIF